MFGILLDFSLVSGCMFQSLIVSLSSCFLFPWFASVFGFVLLFCVSLNYLRLRPASSSTYTCVTAMTLITVVGWTVTPVVGSQVWSLIFCFLSV